MKNFNYLKYVVFILSIYCLSSCRDEITIEEVKQFLPESAISSEIRVFSGDLNRDGIEDALLRFKIENEPAENEHFYILLRRNEGSIVIDSKDIFKFNNKNGLVFDKVTISKESDFSVNYSGKGDNSGSYRKITFKYHADKAGNDYWILDRDEELFQHKDLSPSSPKPIVVTKSDMRDIGGEYFGNIKEHLYDAMLLMKIKKYIPSSVSECRAYSGDLNRDQFDDIILRFKLKNEPEYRDHFYLFLGQENGIYKLAAKNDSLDFDNVDGTAFDKVVIKNGYFSLEYSGYGNTSGSYNIITFKYSKEDKNWLLHRQGSKFVHRYFTEGESSENITTQKDFGKILFKDFGSW